MLAAATIVHRPDDQFLVDVACASVGAASIAPASSTPSAHAGRGSTRGRRAPDFEFDPRNVGHSLFERRGALARGAVAGGRICQGPDGASSNSEGASAAAAYEPCGKFRAGPRRRGLAERRA